MSSLLEVTSMLKKNNLKLKIKNLFTSISRLRVFAIKLLLKLRDKISLFIQKKNTWQAKVVITSISWQLN
jgi:hypothetical protein